MFEPPPQSLDIPIWKRWIFGFWASVNDQFVVAADNQDITSSTTLTDDSELQVTLEKSGIYNIEFFIVWTSASSTPDVQFLFLEPDGTFYYTGITNVAGTPAVVGGKDISPAATLQIALSGQTWFSGRILAYAGTTGGAFKLQWAQNTSDATSTTREKGSWMRSKRIN